MKKYFRNIILLIGIFYFHYSLKGQSDTTNISNLLKMSLSDLMNQEVITSSKFNQKVAEAASSISVITSDEIKYFNYSTLGEALNSLSGFYLSSDKNYLYTGSRGFSRPTDYNNRIVVMIDGHVMNEVVYGSISMENAMGLNLGNIDRIEIIRGPGASIYGSGAMLDIINIILKKGSQTNGLEVSAGSGSYGRNEISAVFGKQVNKLDISTSAIGGISNGENYYFPELNNSLKNYGVSKGMDWEKFAGFQTKVTYKNFNIAGLLTGRLKSIPTGAFGTNLNGKVYTEDDRSFLEMSYKFQLGKRGSILLRGYFDNYYYSGTYPSNTVDSSDESSRGKWGGSELQYYQEIGKRNILTAGLEYKNILRTDYKELVNSKVYFNKNFPYSFYSLNIQDQFNIIKQLSLTAGLDMTCIQYLGTP